MWKCRGLFGGGLVDTQKSHWFSLSDVQGLIAALLVRRRRGGEIDMVVRFLELFFGAEETGFSRWL
jgi:hypothetical protein